MAQRDYSSRPVMLQKLTPFAEGGNRYCYIHPDNSSLCIKISKPGEVTRLKTKAGPFKRLLRGPAYFDDNVGEYQAYQQPAIRHNEPEIYDHIPKCYGWQDTDIGRGLVLDYFGRDHGTPCPTLRMILQKDGLTESVRAQLAELADYLRRTQLLTKNIIPHNVVIAADGKLKIIDGLGLSSPYNIARVSAAARRKYIERRIKRMYLRMDWEVSDKSKTWEETEEQGRRLLNILT